MNMSDFEPFHAYACRHRHCSPAAALCRSNHTLQMMLNIIAQTSACSSRLSGDHNGTLLSGAFKFGAPAGTLSFPTGPAKLGTTPAITASGKASEAQPPSTPHCMPAIQYQCLSCFSVAPSAAGMRGIKETAQAAVGVVTGSSMPQMNVCRMISSVLCRFIVGVPAEHGSRVRASVLHIRPCCCIHDVRHPVSSQHWSTAIR